MRLLAAGAEGEQDGRGRLSLLTGFWDQSNFGQDMRGETFDFHLKWLWDQLNFMQDGRKKTFNFSSISGLLNFVLHRGGGNPSLLKGFWGPVELLARWELGGFSFGDQLNILHEGTFTFEWVLGTS